MRNSLTLAMQLQVIEWLKRHEKDIQGETYAEIAKKCESDLKIPMTFSNVKGIMSAIGMGTRERGNSTERDISTLVELVHGLYQANEINTPPALVRLLAKYKL